MDSRNSLQRVTNAPRPCRESAMALFRNGVVREIMDSNQAVLWAAHSIGLDEAGSCVQVSVLRKMGPGATQQISLVCYHKRKCKLRKLPSDTKTLILPYISSSQASGSVVGCRDMPCVIIHLCSPIYHLRTRVTIGGIPFERYVICVHWQSIFMKPMYSR